MGILGDKLPVILGQIRELKPKTYIEVGCYRCDTMRDVQKLGVPRIIGFDLFKLAPDQEEPPLDGPPVSFEEARKEFEVYPGDTNKTLNILSNLTLERPIVVFIDGGHSFKTTLNDIKIVNTLLPDATLLIDDTSMPGVSLAMEASDLDWKVVGLETARYSPVLK